MASLLFRDAIDYTRVRIHGRRYMPFQPKNCAMTPNGSIYFHHSCFLDDYASAKVVGRHWFMHEMVHLWRFAHLSGGVSGHGLSKTVCTSPLEINLSPIGMVQHADLIVGTTCLASGTANKNSVKNLSMFFTASRAVCGVRECAFGFSSE